MAQASILEYFLENVGQYGSKVAAQVKRDGRYHDVTWKEMGDEAQAVAQGLVAAGVAPGDRVAILANTRLEWVTTDMGVLAAGAVTVPIYPSTLPDDCAYIIENSGTQVLFVEDDKQASKFRDLKAQVGGLKKVVQMTGAVTDASGGWVVSLADFKKDSTANAAELETRRRSLNKDSILTIIYTSGTTGRPKGVVITHDAMVYEADAIAKIQLITADDVQLFFLPLAHVFAKVLEVAWLSTRNVMAFAESINTIKENLGEVKPTIMAGVPRIFEKFHAAVVGKGTAGGGLKTKLFLKAAELSQKNGEAEQSGKSLSLADALLFAVLKKVIFSKVGEGLRGILGGRMRAMISGGAPLSPTINWFFRDAGVLILEGYGLTETSAATCVNLPHHNHIGSVGRPLPGTELKIAADGEIMIKGRGVMREYWKNPEATAEVLKDGWFYTGDIGRIEPDGALKITDRKKDIIVTAGGKNVAPQNIENTLKTNKLISQAVVHGDKRKFLSALITVDPDALKAFAAEKGLGNGAYAELTQKPEVTRAVEDVIADLNKHLASYETIKKFKVLEHDFTVESGELTPSLKVKRKLINERYKQIFDGFYVGGD